MTVIGYSGVHSACTHAYYLGHRKLKSRSFEVDGLNQTYCNVERVHHETTGIALVM